LEAAWFLMKEPVGYFTNTADLDNSSYFLFTF